MCVRERERERGERERESVCLYVKKKERVYSVFRVVRETERTLRESEKERERERDTVGVFEEERGGGESVHGDVRYVIREERERERESVCVCVCVKKKERVYSVFRVMRETERTLRERERGRERDRETVGVFEEERGGGESVHGDVRYVIRRERE